MDSRSIPPFVLLLIVFAYDAHACETTRRLKPTPGTGWDALESKPMNEILDIRYDKCLTTDDLQFATPDGTQVTSVKGSSIDVELITDWSKYNPTTARTLKSESIKESELSKIDGFFTPDHAATKKRQLKEKIATVRTTLRSVVYKLAVRSDERLDAKFADRLEQIARELKEGNYRAAVYIADTLVMHFGTHLVRSVDIGSVFGRDDYVSVDFVEKNAEFVAEVARTSFLDENGLRNASTTSTISAANRSSYDSLRLGHSVFTIGRAGYEKLDLAEWESGLNDHLAVIDRSGLRLDLALRRMSLNLSHPYIGQAIDYVQEAVERYYRVNIHKGCIAAASPLYDSSANFDAGQICTQPQKTQYLGGFYQTCSLRGQYEINYCEKLIINNAGLGSSTCPYQFSDQPVIHTEIANLCPLIPKDIKKNCISDVTTHVCITDVRPAKMFSFGGVYSHYVSNMVTKSKTCPASFKPAAMLGNGHMHVCVGADTVDGAKVTEMSFGGLCSDFDKCPNKSCPAGYSQHFGSFFNGEAIYYCARMGSSNVDYEAVLLRPPYLVVVEQDAEVGVDVKNKTVLFCLLLNVLIGLCLDL